MKRTISFTKMQGLGNDYIYVNTMLYPIANPSALSIRLSDRHRGIGSDGLILIGRSEKADFSMRIFNADGSEARMCGNGARCVGRYLYDCGLTDKKEITLETLSGVKTLNLTTDGGGEVTLVTVGMGQARPLTVRHEDGSYGTLTMDKVCAEGYCFTGTAVDMGNPHLVLFVNDALDAPVETVGPLFEHSYYFGDGANIEFAQIIDRTHIRMRVWERGSGVTQACGTGACATIVAAAMADLVSAEGCTVTMDGGSLYVSWNPDTGEVTMTGGAEKVFDGTVEIE